MEDFDVVGIEGVPTPLPIGPGPATGHRWTLTLPPGVERTDASPGDRTDAAASLGGSQGDRLQVIAAAGEYDIVATLARPWDENPVRTVHIHLTVTPRQPLAPGPVLS